MTTSRTPGPFGLTYIRDELHEGILSRTTASRPGIVASDFGSGPRLGQAITRASLSPATAAQGAGARSNAAEKRVISVIHARHPTFHLDARGYRLIEARLWSPGEFEARYEVVPLSDAQAILARAASGRMVSKPERAAFEEAQSLLADPRARRQESGLLLLRLRPPPRYTQSSGSEAVTPSQLARMIREKEQKEHWIEIELVLPDGKSVANERFRIVTPDDREITGMTDSRGRARVDGIFAEGDCVISFPDLYDDEWRRA